MGFEWRDWGSGKRLALVDEVVTAAYFDGRAPLEPDDWSGTHAATNQDHRRRFGRLRYHDVRGEPAGRSSTWDSVIESVSHQRLR